MPSKRNSVSSHSRNRGERAVRAVLPPAAKITADRADREADLVVNGQPVEVKWIGTGNLADIRSALKQQPRPNVIFVGRQMSPGACAALSEAGVSWADETGAAEITIGRILVSRSGIPEKRPQGIKHWTPAVVAVTEALLCGTRGTQAAMQEATGLSAGSCANALRFPADKELVTSTA